MITVLIIMILGIGIGIISRKFPSVIKANEKLISVAIYLLLFLLGVSVGTNKEIISNLYNLGFQALIITLGATAGSIFLCWIIYKFFFGLENSEIDNPNN
jgi:uncharacterized membrane protein YbjE (DUF340 family)